MPKHILSIVLAFAVLSGVQRTAYADVIASWNFSNLAAINAGNTVVVGSTNAGAPAGSTLTVTNSSVSNLGLTTVTTGANPALSLPSTAPRTLPPVTSAENNGTTLTFRTSTLGFTNLSVSFDARSFVGTDPSPEAFRFTLASSTNNVNYTVISGPTLPAVSVAGTFVSYPLVSSPFSLSSSLNNVSDIYLRLTLSGAGASSGSFDLDNFSISGTNINAVPEPSSLALVGLAAAAFVKVQRRRRLKQTLND